MRQRPCNDEALKRIRSAASKSSAITKEIGALAVQANLLAFETCARAARSGSAGEDVARAADRVRQVALRAQDAAWRTNLIIDECEEFSRNVDDLNRGIQERLALVIASVDDFSSVVKELMDGVRGQLNRMDLACNDVAAFDEQVSATPRPPNELS